MPIRPFIKYHGGKYYLCKWIVSTFPDHERYIEPFGGSASVLFNKTKSTDETYNELNKDIYSIFYAIKHHLKDFSDKVATIEYNRENFNKSKIIHYEDVVENAAWAFARCRMSRGGQRVSYAWSSRFYRGLPEQISTWLSTQQDFPKYHERLKNVQIFNEDAIDFIAAKGAGSLIYCDPPYMHDTRIYKNAYEKEMSVEDHSRLAQVLNAIDAKVVISGYRCDEYDKWYYGWRRLDHEVPNHSSQKKQKDIKTECLWINF